MWEPFCRKQHEVALKRAFYAFTLSVSHHGSLCPSAQAIMSLPSQSLSRTDASSDQTTRLHWLMSPVAVSHRRTKTSADMLRVGSALTSRTIKTISSRDVLRTPPLCCGVRNADSATISSYWVTKFKIGVDFPSRKPTWFHRIHLFVCTLLACLLADSESWLRRSRSWTAVHALSANKNFNANDVLKRLFWCFHSADRAQFFFVWKIMSFSASYRVFSQIHSSVLL